MAAPAATSEIKKLKQGFPQQALVCVAIIAAIHILPKSHDPRDSFRLIFTVAYFGAAYAQRRHGYVMDAIHMPTRTPHAALSATSRTVLAVLTKSI